LASSVQNKFNFNEGEQSSFITIRGLGATEIQNQIDQLMLWFGSFEREIKNLYFLFGNANNILNDVQSKFIIKNVKSISFNFPDPWFKKRHYKRRIIQPEFINLLSNTLQKGCLIFIKTDVKDLIDYMDFTISSNFSFKKIDKKDFDSSESFNPNRLLTNREKHVIVNELDIFERIYIKI